VLEAYQQMGKTAEALDNGEVKSLPQAIYIATSLLIEWMRGQIHCSELGEIECQQCKNRDQIQNAECEFGQ
jgi:hypothetical protein